MAGDELEEGAKEEEEGVCTVNRKVVAEFWGLGGIDTPLMRVERGFAVGFGLSCHRGICLRENLILGGGWVCLVLSSHMRNRGRGVG